MKDATPDKTKFSHWNWRRLSGGTSIIVLAVTFVFYRGIQTASLLQVVAFSVAYGVTLLLVVISIRGGTRMNWILASMSGAGLAGMMWLMCIG